MTEFEEIALKKIVKDCLIDNIYHRINTVCGNYGISNAEVSKHIGWDPAGYNQKYNRSNDLRITTFIKIYSAIKEIISEKEAQFGFTGISADQLSLNDFITEEAIDLGHLFNHISAAAEGKAEFLNDGGFVETYKSLRAFVMRGRNNKKYSDREVDVYIDFFKQTENA